MLFHVVDGDKGRLVDTSKLPLGDSSVVMLVSTGSVRNLLELDQAVRSIDPAIRRSTRLFVFRLPLQFSGDLRSHLTTGEDQLVLEGRLEGADFAFLTLNANGEPELISKSDISKIVGPDELIQGLRTAELRSLLKQPGVELPGIDGFHYVGPNGRHYDRFLRIGFAMNSARAIEAYLFWLQEYLAENQPLLVDTGGILTLAYAAQAKMKGIEVSALEGYSNELPRNFAGSKVDATILVSVSSSGAMATRLKTEFTDIVGGSLRVISLYGYESFTPAEGDSVLCRLGEDMQHYHAADCRTCKDSPDSTIVPINPNTYLLEISGAVKTTRIRAQDAAEANSFFSKYSGCGAVALHKNDDLNRHHMVFLETGVLLGTKAFSEQLKKTVAAIRTNHKIQHVICPPHANAVALAKIVIAELGLQDSSLVVASEEDQNAFKPLAKREGHCLIVDDVLITGNRILGFKNALHSVGCDFGAKEIAFLVGVDRSPSKDDSTKVKDMFDRGGSFYSVERLMLPHWNEKRCPWCRELEAIKNCMSSFEGDAMMKKRFEQLQAPVIADAFLPGVIGAPQTLGQTSIFMPKCKNTVEIFASVASAIQHLRSEGLLSEHRDMPIARILDRKYTLSGRFYDVSVTASIVRACSEHDLRTFSEDEDLRDHLDQRYRRRSGTEVFGELLFASGVRKLPAATRTDSILKKLDTEYPGLAFLLKQLNQERMSHQ